MLEIVLIFAAAGLSSAGIAWLGRQAFIAWRQYRGKRIVTCPETGGAVSVEVDALRAAATAPFGGGPDLVVKYCARGPEREACAQACLSEIEGTPNPSRVRARSQSGREGTCDLCDPQEVDEVERIGNPALPGPDREAISWFDVALQDVPRALATGERICEACYAAESFRARYASVAGDEARLSDRTIS